VRPRRPHVACLTRRRHTSSASPASRIEWNGSSTGTASGSSSAEAALKPVNPSIETTSTRSRHTAGRPASQVLKTCLERPSTMSSNRPGPVPARTGVRSMTTVTNLGPWRVCRQQRSSTPMTRTPSKRCGSAIRTRRPSSSTTVLAVLHETASASATRATVKCWQTMPSAYPQPGPARPGPGHHGPRPGRPGRVLAPHVLAGLAAEAADRDQQDRGAPPERLIRQPPGHADPHDALTTAAPAPAIRLICPRIGGNPAGQDRTIGLQMLPEDDKPEAVQAAERGQVRANEGNVGHVEVVRMGSVRTPILGRPRPSPRDRRAHPGHTLICEEPVMTLTPCGPPPFPSDSGRGQ